MLLERCLPVAMLLAAIAQAAPPQAVISNGFVRATVALPNEQRGAYRGSRFDWSGVITDLEFAGHRIFGPWSEQTDPTAHDNIAGPVEEFTSDEGALGFAQAKPGELFVKVGVGALRKPDERAYQFFRKYQIVGTGVWAVRPTEDHVEFEQRLREVEGYGYIYRKTVRLVRNKPELVLEHSLKNTGKQPIVTGVYDHDFFVMDGKATGPAVRVEFAFAPRPVDRLMGPISVKGNELTYSRMLKPEGDAAFGLLAGYGGNKRDNDVRVEHRTAGIGVRQIGDFPVAKLNFWSVRTTVCPEIYKQISIGPGKTAHWKLRYMFYELNRDAAIATKKK